MLLHFYKFAASGSGYLITDNRKGDISLSREAVRWLCDARHGVGADAILLLETIGEKSPQADFAVKMLHPAKRDNGLPDPHAIRSIARFASVFQEDMTRPLLLATEWGEVLAEFIDDLIHIKLPLSGVGNFHYKTISWGAEGEGHCFVGSKATMAGVAVDDLKDIDVVETGRMVARESGVQGEGAFISFVETGWGSVNIRTFGVGVGREVPCPGETVPAVMLTFGFFNNWESPIEIQEPGEEAIYVGHELNEEKTDVSFITVRGSADFVFEGDIEIFE